MEFLFEFRDEVPRRLASFTDFGPYNYKELAVVYHAHRKVKPGSYNDTSFSYYRSVMFRLIKGI